MLRVALSILLFTGSLIAETALSGDIGGKTFEPTGNPYIVSDNILVQEGQTTTIMPGCIFLFQPFSGMIVDGDLVVKGTLEKPIVFTTIHDKTYNPTSEQLPNPFDWNGILVSKKSNRVIMGNFILTYSVYGLKSQKEAFIIENGTFKQNGQFHLTVNEQIKQVVEGLPYTYGEQYKTGEKAAVERAGNKPLGIVLGVSGLAAGAMGGVFFKQYLDSYEEYQNARAGFDELVAKMDQQIIIAAIGGGVMLIAIPVAFIVGRGPKVKKDPDTNLSWHPLLGTQGAGVLLSARF
jgi:hypothetical protein